MTTKGIIKSIDYNTNTCIVRIPLYETANNEDEVTVKATFAIQPGLFGGFKVDDVVFVVFEESEIDSPVIIGKLFLGNANEATEARSAATLTNLVVTESAKLPLDTKIAFNGNTDTIASVDKGIDSYKSIKDIVMALQQQNQSLTEQQNDLANKLSTNQDGSITGFGWKLDENSWRIQSYNDRNHLPIIDILRVDNQGLTVAGDVKIQGYPSKIEVTYTTTNSPLESSLVGATWTATVPAWEDGKYIWQKTTTYTYQYNSETQLLDEQSDEKIVCLTGQAGASGQSAYSYWLNISRPVHVGTKQLENITIAAMVKIGAGVETVDESAYLFYKWGANGTITAASTASHNSLNFTPAHCQDADLTVYATHDSTVTASTLTPADCYETEAITFSPLNTPVLDLSNDSAAIAYTAAGTKVTTSDEVSSTATLYLNGDPVNNVNYFWTLTGCTKKSTVEYTDQEIIITGLTSNTATALCEATIDDTNSPYNGLTVSKVFTITKQIKGDDGLSASAYWINVNMPVHTGLKRNKNIEITTHLQVGESPEAEDTSAIIKYKWAGELDEDPITHTSNWKSPTYFNNKYLIGTALSLKRDEDLIIQASHHNANNNTDIIYDTEIITFSPLNTPILDLTNDSAAISYFGDDKIGNNTVESTATLYLNGSAFSGTVSYAWTLTHCKTSTNATTASGQTVTIATIDNGYENAYAECTATFDYNGETGLTVTKKFTVVKQQKGDSAVIYRLAINMPVHTGLNRTDNIEVRAWKKVGNEDETADTTSGSNAVKITYLWTSEIENNNDPLTTHILTADSNHLYTITTSNKADEDLTVYYYHGNTELDKEVITFSPLNTPILDLSNDSDALPYDENGIIGSPAPTVSSTAKVFLNGAEISATITWTVVNSSCTISQSQNTVTVSALSINKAAARCTATNIANFNGLTLTKDFNITKQIKGRDGQNAGSYWLDVSKDVHTGINQKTSITVTAYRQIGETAIEEDTSTVLFINGNIISNDPSATRHKKTFSISEIKSNTYNSTDIVIVGAHYDAVSGLYKPYDTETIEYSPNTPIISLTNDIGQIKVAKDGTTSGNTETTAKLYINGEYITSNVSFNWGSVPEGAFIDTSTGGVLDDTLIVSPSFDATNYTFTCTATYNGNTYTKDFKFVKIIDGQDGEDGDSIALKNSELDCAVLGDSFIANGTETITLSDGTSITATAGHLYSLSSESPKKYTDAGKFQGEDGSDAVSYWLDVSMAVHTGNNRTLPIEIKAWKKVGDGAEERDTGATIKYKWKSDPDSASSYHTMVLDTDRYLLTTNAVNANNTANDDIIIYYYHSSTVIDTETITYSPLNTPILDLSNDSASLPYNILTGKIGNSTVSSTANVYLNGEILSSANINWDYTSINCNIGSGNASVSSNTITVSEITNDTAYATCTATYNLGSGNKTISKIFTITRQYQGAQGAQGPEGPQGPDGQDGQNGNDGVSVTETKQWYILKASNIQSVQRWPNNTAEPSYNPTPDTTTVDQWMLTPPDAVNGYNIWTCTESIYSDSTVSNLHITYTNPVRDNAYALAQGKSTNYYSDTVPIGNVKEGDGWFDTGYTLVSPTPTEKSKYLDKYYIVENASGAYVVNNTTNRLDAYTSNSSGTRYNVIQITPTNIDTLISNNTIVVGTTTVYAKNLLKQYHNNAWEIVENEQIFNKLTTNYLNAMDITAKRIEVKDSSNTNTLFLADGVSGSPTANTVKIANFNVGNDYQVLTGGPYLSVGTLGESGSVLVSPSYRSYANIANSGTELKTWAFAAGNGFGVTTSGQLYARNLTTTGLKIRKPDTINDLDIVAGDNEATAARTFSIVSITKTAIGGGGGIFDPGTPISKNIIGPGGGGDSYTESDDYNTKLVITLSVDKPVPVPTHVDVGYEWVYWTSGTNQDPTSTPHYALCYGTATFIPGSTTAEVTIVAKKTAAGAWVTGRWNPSTVSTANVYWAEKYTNNYQCIRIDNPASTLATLSNISPDPANQQDQQGGTASCTYTFTVNAFKFDSDLLPGTRTISYSYSGYNSTWQEVSYTGTANVSDMTIGTSTAPWTALYATTIYRDSEKSLSDRRLKKNISYEIDKFDGLLDKLQPTAYNLITVDQNKTHLGFIAQDVAQSLKDLQLDDMALVDKVDNGVYNLDYQDLHALEVYEIQKLKKEIADLKTEIQELKK